MAWQLMTEVYGIPADRLYVTYFAGNDELGLIADEECRDIWLQIGYCLTNYFCRLDRTSTLVAPCCSVIIGKHMNFCPHVFK